MTERARRSTRRDLIAATLGGAASLAFSGEARAQRKLTKKESEYQDTPKAGILMCATCTLFEPPKGCKVVEGDVNPEGWCNVFDLAD